MPPGMYFNSTALDLVSQSDFMLESRTPEQLKACRFHFQLPDWR